MKLIKPLLQLLLAARAIGQARYGAVQIYNARLDRLQIVAHFGCSPTLINTLRLIDPASTHASARAFRLGKRVLIPDVAQDPFYLPHLPLAQMEGYRALQCTPILAKDQKPIGVFSTGFATVYHLTRAETDQLDKYAAQAARLIQIYWVYEGAGAVPKRK